MNGTLQGRLVNELKLARARSLEAANAYIQDFYLQGHNQAFAVEPRESESAFVTRGEADLDEIFARETIRQVGKDNVVSCGATALQISKQPGRKTCAGLAVLVRQQMDGRWSIHRGTQLLGRYEADGRPVEAAGPVENRGCPTKTLDAGQRRRRPQLPQAPAAANL